MIRVPKKRVRTYGRPKLSHPSLVAAWPGISNVAIGAASYLADKLDAKEFAQIDPLGFFPLNGALIEENIVLSPQFPQSKFYYWKNKTARGDLIIFLGQAQPASQAYEFAHEVLALAQRFGVQRVYTLAAALATSFEEKTNVWAAATEPKLLEELQESGLLLKGNFYVSGMNGLLLSVAKEINMEGLCLLGETPQYAAQIQNPAASLAVLEVLTQILRIQIDLGELRDLVARVKLEMAKLSKESQREFIDRFTIPIWEHREEDENA